MRVDARAASYSVLRDLSSHSCDSWLFPLPCVPAALRVPRQYRRAPPLRQWHQLPLPPPHWLRWHPPTEHRCGGAEEEQQEKKRQEDEEKRKKIKKENERKEILRQAEIEKKRAKKLNMTISQYRNYKSQVKLCKTDWKKCTDNKMLVNEFDGIVKIKTACKLQANSQAKYGDPQWKWITFGTFLKGNDYIKNGLVVLFDNQVKFQNGFGAYKKTEVECIYSLKSNKITALRIN